MTNAMNYRNAKYCADNIRINCEIEHPDYGWIPFLCDPADTGARFDVVELHERMVADGEVAQMSQVEIDTEVASTVRFKRNDLLAKKVDPVVSNPLRWNSLTEDQQQKIAAYRQSLLDLPRQEGFPHSISWPEFPL